MGVEPFVCSATQISNESCIFVVVVGDSLSQKQVGVNEMELIILVDRRNSKQTHYHHSLRPREI